MTKVSDLIVKFLEEHGVVDIFGYPGVGCGHLMNSLSASEINVHTLYNEQGCAFAACGYAQASKKIGVAYSTSGPGGTNLLTGIANAFCDSIPSFFIVGDKDYSSLRKEKTVRQLTSQEIDIVNMAKPITKFSFMVTNPYDIIYYLEYSFFLAFDSRPGPILLDIPSDIQRAEVDYELLRHFKATKILSNTKNVDLIISAISQSSKPLILVGNGVRQNGLESLFLKLDDALQIPFVSTLISFDEYCDCENYLGFIGMDGDLSANIAVRECDCLITFGARLNFKQCGYNRKQFAPNAKILRVDIDESELDVSIRSEIKIVENLNSLLKALLDESRRFKNHPLDWLKYCQNLKKEKFRNEVSLPGYTHVAKISQVIQPNTFMTVDVGSHRRWVMKSFVFKTGQRIFQSSGLVSMGYSLPAAIGVFYANKQPVICFDGDGGIMMNMQEMEYIKREKLPINIILLNNNCLGDIMEFQKKIFDKNYFSTTPSSGYQSADFKLIAKAFNFSYETIFTFDDISKIKIKNQPCFYDVIICKGDNL